MSLFNPETFYPSDEFLEAYEEALMKMEDTDLATWLAYRSGKPQSEIAVRMGITQTGVSRRLRKISLALKSEVLRAMNEKESETPQAPLRMRAR